MASITIVFFIFFVILVCALQEVLGEKYDTPSSAYRDAFKRKL